MAHVRLESLDLNLLVVLDALLSARSVTLAGSRLGLSQPAVSNALSRLRATLGDPLLVRTPHGMVPTARAEALQLPLRESLERLGALVAGDPALDPRHAKRTFAVAATDYVQLVLLPPLARRLHREAPNVVLRVSPIMQRFSWDALEEGSVDLIIANPPSTPAGLRKTVLFHDDVVCILRKGHPLARRTLTLDGYLSCSHVETLPLGGRGLADQVLARAGHARKIALTVPHFLIPPFIVATTDHCFTLARRIAEPIAKILPVKVRALPFAVPPFKVSAHWHERSHRDGAHEWLRGVVREVAEGLAVRGHRRRE